MIPRDGCVRASIIARRLNIGARTIRKWIVTGYIEGTYRSRSYWVMVRAGQITILDKSRKKVGALNVAECE